MRTKTPMFLVSHTEKPNGEKRISFAISPDAVPVLRWIILALLVTVLIALGVSASDVRSILSHTVGK